ncbi:MAG: hypothetical protein ABH877_02475 [bacterium]
MGLFDNLTSCTKPFNEKYEWELAVPATPVPYFEWLGGEMALGWTAGACKDWMTRMWAVKSGGKILHSGSYYHLPSTGQEFWTYFGSPEGAKVDAPSATSFVENAEAAGFVFVGRQSKPEPDPDPDKPDEPVKPDKAILPWVLGILGVGALVTVIVSKTKKPRAR